MTRREYDRREGKYCYGSHSIQARICVQVLGEKARGRGCNDLVNQRIATRLGRLERKKPKWEIWYKHTFAGDVVRANNTEEAKKLAIEILKEEFSDKNISFPCTCIGYNEPINSYEDLIEEICLYQRHAENWD